ncbi:MAG: hypothetical protein ACKKL4_01820 [Patescibacteria group bacterium]
MSELPPKKFKYKKDQKDWVLIGIIIFTFICFGLIFYGIRYFDSYQTDRESLNRNEFNELVKNREALENQINQYLEDSDFNPNN